MKRTIQFLTITIIVCSTFIEGADVIGSEKNKKSLFGRPIENTRRAVNKKEKEIITDFLVEYKQALESGKLYEFFKKHYYLSYYGRSEETYSELRELAKEILSNKDIAMKHLSAVFKSKIRFAEKNQDLYAYAENEYSLEYMLKKGKMKAVHLTGFRLVWDKTESRYFIEYIFWHWGMT